MQRYDSKEDFYKDYPDLDIGWEELESFAPGGLKTTFLGLHPGDELDEAPRHGNWPVSIACAFFEIRKIERAGQGRVPGAVVATNSESGEIAVLISKDDIRYMAGYFDDVELGIRKPKITTLEELQAELESHDEYVAQLLRRR